jgi:hypothetical protein
MVGSGADWSDIVYKIPRVNPFAGYATREARVLQIPPRRDVAAHGACVFTTSPGGDGGGAGVGAGPPSRSIAPTAPSQGTQPGA